MKSLKTYRYEIWNGKKVLAHHESSYLIAGQNFFQFKEFNIPVNTRIMKNDGVDVLVRFVLDVSQMTDDELDRLLRKI